MANVSPVLVVFPAAYCSSVLLLLQCPAAKLVAAFPFLCNTVFFLHLYRG